MLERLTNQDRGPVSRDSGSKWEAGTSVAHASDPGLVFSLRGENSSKLYLPSCNIMILNRSAAIPAPVKGERES